MITKQDQLNQILETLRSESGAIRGVAAVSPDGMIIASDFDGDRGVNDVAAAMGATILDLGGKVTQSLAAGSMQEIIIRGDVDFIVVLSIKSKGALIIQAKKSIALGFLLLKARQSLNQLAAII